ncbi:MAG: vWA domain-containing protein [Bryobacteraceae bacterium]
MDRWEDAVPQGIGGRTEIDKAIQRAAGDFEGMPAAARKHLLVVSDGELDVGPHNRGTGAPFQPEERTAYRGIFGSIESLRSLDVTVHTIAIDELAGADESRRQEEIRTRLRATGGASVPEQFLRLLDHLQRGEGPYFLHALAQSLLGRPRSVLPGNVLDVVWQTIFPEAVLSGRVAPGSRNLVVFARANEPVRLCLEGSNELLLRYDAQSGGIVREPQDSSADVYARRLATSQYATWLIDAPQATCVEPRRAYHGNNVALRWLPDKPAHAGDPLPIELDLWRWSEQEPSLAWWRTYMADQILHKRINAVATVSPPEGPPIPVVLDAKVVSGHEEVVVLTGRLPEAAAAGSYTISAKLVVGDSNQAWEETVAPKTFQVGERPGIFDGYRWLWAIIIIIVAILAALLHFRPALVWRRRAPIADFKFVIHHEGGVEVTDPMQPRVVSFVAKGEQIHSECGTRADEHGPTAIFEPVSRSSYKVRVVSGTGWQYRRVDNDPNVPSSAFMPLGQTGVAISKLDFVNGHALELKHGKDVVQIRHAGYPDRLIHHQKRTGTHD